MKNVVLSIVVIAALMAAGIGGTLADFNDYEVSEDNSFKMGSMDLVISDPDGNEYNGDTVPTLITVDNGWPDCSKDRNFDIHNAGENEQTAPWVYIHFKNFECDWVDTKVTDTTPFAYMDYDVANGVLTRHEDDDGDDIGINEPQDVAIFGGVAGEDVNGDPVTVPGISDDAICLLSDLLQVEISYSIAYSEANNPGSWAAVPAGDKTILDLGAYDDMGNDDGIVQLAELECYEIYLFQLPGCNTRWMNVSLRAVNIAEEEFQNADGSTMDYFDETIVPEESKWNNWPTNATQNQILMWDIGFEMFGQATQPNIPQP
jgi:predicted ribosomally synthesized peptide with SipW-like signal peptide